MSEPSNDRRRNQRLRTRKDLLLAAARLLKAGKTPTMDDVAEEALVSRATAYRYFPSLERLLVEAPLDDAMPDPRALFAGDSTMSAEDRVDKAEAALHAMICRNEAQLRVMLAHSLMQTTATNGASPTPIRQNRRTPLIEAALAPVRDQLDNTSYKRLCAALAMVFGTESMLVFRDVLSVSDQEARKVKSWAVRALVRAALDN
jgi:AcrR family transcriptional regulator